MANALTFDQVSTILAEIVSQATGEKVLAPVDTSEFVTLGQKALLTGYDPLNTALSQTLSRTIFSRRPYNAKFKMLNVTEEQYGNHVRKVQPVDRPFEDDQKFDLVDGQSIDPYTVRKPKVVQTNFYGAEIWAKKLTIYKDQLDNAVTGSSQFGQFISMVMGNADDQIEQARENMSRSTLNNLTAGIYLGTNAFRKHNVLAMYNEYTGSGYTLATIFQPGNYNNFCRWLYSHINTVSDLLTERSIVYHDPIGADNIMRHTPKSDQRLYIHSGFERQMETIATSVVYHDNKTVFPPHETVNFWQSIEDSMHINVTPSVLDSSGNAVKGDEVDIPKLVGVLFDREAAGVTTVNQWTAMTPLNAAGGYWNQWWHFTTRFWNDFTENAVIFYMADEPPTQEEIDLVKKTTKK